MLRNRARRIVQSLRSPSSHAHLPLTPRRCLIAIFAVAVAAACFAVSARAVTEPTGPQPVLPKQTLVIVGSGRVHHVFHVEIAKTPQEQTTGLMFRNSVGPTDGMLFPWGRPIESQMWMKNTLVPLDMVFIKADGTIGRIAENTVPQSLAIIVSEGPVIATLELEGGITAKLGITVGNRVLSPALGTNP